MENPLLLSIEQMRRNPLTTGLPKKLNQLEMALALRNRPINPEHVHEVSMEDRIFLVERFKAIFVPYSVCITAAIAIQDLLHSGLNARNPLLAQNRNFIFSAALLKGTEASQLEWWPNFASGIVIEGITGTGKSQVVDRYLSLIPRTIDHGPGPGWQALTQLVYLKVHMPADGSRGGFLELAFRALDDALGTSYTAEYSSSRWRVERKLVVFLHLLSVHRCGLLIIEEAQEQNLSSSRFGREFVTFFLRILNWGIPTVLIGNPLAFDVIRGFSQDVDRFSEGGWHQMLPVLDPESAEWKEHWIPGLWSPTLLDSPDALYVPHTSHPLDQGLAGFIWRRTGGVPRYVCRLRREVQELALRKRASTIDAAMIDQVYKQSPKMKALHGRIEALTQRNWVALQPFSDMPAAMFRKLWEQPTRHVDVAQQTATAPGRAELKTEAQKRPKPRTRAKRAKVRTSQETFQERQIEALLSASGKKGGE